MLDNDSNELKYDRAARDNRVSNNRNRRYRKRMRAKRTAVVKQAFLQAHPRWDDAKQFLRSHYREILEGRFGFSHPEKIQSYQELGEALGFSKQCCYEYYGKALRELAKIEARLDEYLALRA